MKVAGGIKRLQTIEGAISPRELLALVREIVHVPEGATARFYLSDPYPSQNLIHAANMGMGTPIHDVSESSPLQFKITWEVPVAKNEQG